MFILELIDYKILRGRNTVFCSFPAGYTCLYAHKGKKKKKPETLITYWYTYI